MKKKKEIKEKKEIKKLYTPNKWLYFLVAMLSIFFVLVSTKKLDNDIWYLLSEGRYIINNGIYYIDPLSMHEGMSIVVQNWLSASIFWIIYSIFGHMGLFTFTIICNLFICLLLYKICVLISDNKPLSLIIMTICDITLSAHYIVIRPQIISFVLLLTVIYLLELYIKKNDKKYLKFLPLISILLINLHASLWWMMFLFILPFIIDSFHNKFLHLQGYPRKPLLIYTGISLLVGLINPYFYKAITFIFTSFGDEYMHKFINELLPYSFNTTLGKHMFIAMLIIGLCYAFFRNNNVRIRYLCLTAGTLILGFSTVKAFSHFIIVAFFPLAYLLKDVFPNDFSDLPYAFKKGFGIMLVILSFLVIGLDGYLYYNDISMLELSNEASDAIDIIDKLKNEDYVSINNLTVYSAFNDGGYVEFRGYKPYIDPRAEAYLKINNGQKDYFQEFYDLEHGNLNVHDFITEYNFTFLLVSKSDYLYSRLSDENYLVIYENPDKGYRLYANKDIFTDKNILKQYEQAYENALQTN